MKKEFLEAAKTSLDFEPVKVKMSLAAWTWLQTEFGLNKSLISDFGKLGFVIAGGAAGCLLDICHGREPLCVPGDVDLFYKGITETYGPALRVLPGQKRYLGLEFRSQSVLELMLRQDYFTSMADNPAAITFEKVINKTTKPSQYIHTSGDSVLWGVGGQGGGSSSSVDKTVTEDPDQPEETKNVLIQLVCGAEPGVMRWDTLGANLKYQGNSEQLEKFAADEIKVQLERQSPNVEVLEDLSRLHQALTAVPYGAIPVWQRFDFTAVCVELDGETLICHPSANDDRLHQNLRIANLQRSPLKLMGRIRKYQQKGFNLDLLEMLKIARMADSLNSAEKEELDRVVNQLSNPNLTGEDAKVLGNLYKDFGDYSSFREADLSNNLREAYIQAYRSSASLVYRQEKLTKWLKDSTMSTLQSKHNTNFFYFM